jgi:ubiquinone/menaquinone biosynthesis C-methylase UbiE
VREGALSLADMGTPDEAKTKAASTYDAAADAYDDPANTFWERFGRKTVERIGLRPGARVLDVCCGSGASALPAAEIVGAKGSVLGIDLSEGLLALARKKARARGFANAEFRKGDALELPVEDGTFDAVVCVFGIFFVPDMTAAVRSLWRAVRPGGKLAVTTWGPRWFEPGSTAFWDAVRAERPDLYKGFNPWDRICEPAAVMELLRSGGAQEIEVVAEAAEHPIPSPEAWWSAVIGTGYRGTYDKLDPKQQERVRAANLEFVRRSGMRTIEANVVYATAKKP